MTDVPDVVADVFESRETFVPSGGGYVVETTSFTGHVTASEGEKWRTDYEVTVRAPTLQAATADEVGPAVREGWLETMTAVKTGVTSSRLAAIDTSATASENCSAFTVPDPLGTSGVCGYSAILMAESENLLLPELIATLDSTSSTKTESLGTLETISARSLA